MWGESVAGGKWEISVPPSQFCCESRTVLKKLSYKHIKKKSWYCSASIPERTPHVTLGPIPSQDPILTVVTRPRVTASPTTHTRLLPQAR